MTASSHTENLGHRVVTVDKLLGRLSSIEPSSLEQLEQWRQEAYQSIDDYCEQKRHELIEKNQIHQEKDLEHLIVRRHLFPLAHSHRTIHFKAGLESAVGTNARHLLVDREGKDLCLLDRSLTIIKEIPFTHDGIHGICWASTIARFIIITFKEIFLLDEKTMQLELCSIPSSQDWWRGTCSNESLFLSTVEWGSSIYEFHLGRSFQGGKEWHAPVSCGKEEIICDLKYNNGFLALPIYNKHKEESRLELRSAMTLENIWSIRIHGRCRCCSIDVDQWLVMDHDDCRFFHISADGKLLEANKYDQHERLEDIIPWGNDDIVVLTKKNINLHKFT